MGDLMHALPALTEAKENVPEASFDWVVDKNFQSVPEWHPAVKSTLVTNHREWKLNLISANTRNEIKTVVNEINQNDYDIVVDMQNNLKSSFISFLIKKEVIGMDSKSAREFPAHLSYSRKASISKDLHAIERQRELMAFALGYETQDKDFGYGISEDKFTNPSFQLPSKYVVCVQNASWVTKQWPVDYWKELILELEPQGLDFLFPSGSQSELEKAREICEVSTRAHALDLLPLNEIAYILNNALFSVCSDTGLAHLSAVTNTPSLTLYGPTNTKLIGTSGINQNHITANNGNLENIKVKEVTEKLKILGFI